MSPWDNNSLDHHHHHRHQDHRHPSFSSTLLDQIYNSIDDSSEVSMRKKQNRADENLVCLEKILVNRRAVSGRDSVRSSRNPKTVEPVFFKHSSSSSSSDSSGFSSSESDSFYRRTAIHHPKPVRTAAVERLERPNNNNKVKSKALKMYSDLKKTKQPISPGGRLATFLNSIFTKKPNKTNTTATSSSTTCSSASSFSRSCLSKTTSSSEKSKRSVRFCPVNEDSKKRSGHKTHNVHKGWYGNNERESTRHRQNFDNIESRVMEEENRRVIEAAKELIRTYQKNKDVVKISVEEEEEEDDDGASCASSDLFELDHLSVIGIGRYREELPVYETTRFNTNRVISR